MEGGGAGGGGGREWIMATGVVVGRGAWSHLREVSEGGKFERNFYVPGHSEGDVINAWSFSR